MAKYFWLCYHKRELFKLISLAHFANKVLFSSGTCFETICTKMGFSL